LGTEGKKLFVNVAFSNEVIASSTSFMLLDLRLVDALRDDFEILSPFAIQKIIAEFYSSRGFYKPHLGLILFLFETS